MAKSRFLGEFVRNVAGVVALSAASAAQVFDVPGNFATLQGALNAVPPGAVIVVHGGVHPPVMVTKPVTIVGSPVATIVNTDVSEPMDPFAMADAIRLAGPGRGRVTLENVNTSGVADGSFFSSSGSGVFGGGFAELHLVDCDIQPAQWTLLTGQAQGADAVRVTVPYVLVERCTVTGGLSDTDNCSYPLNPDGGAGIHAASATVTALDSTVKGGRGPIMCFPAGNCPSLPLPESDGGPGIVATEVLRAASVITGGKGQPVTCGGHIIGVEADGPPIVASAVTDLGTALSASGPAVLGATWTLIWSTTPPSALLAFGAPTTVPVPIGTKGLLFLHADTLTLVPVPGGAGQVLMANLPALPVLAGVELGVQLYDVAAKKLTRPVVAVLRP
jgi:hypothetical protein